MYLDYLLLPFKLCLIDSEINKLTKELEVMANEFKLLFKMNSNTLENHPICRKNYAELKEKYRKNESIYKNWLTKKQEIKLKESNINLFMKL